MATPGTLLGGRYRLIDVIGDGGMARVFRAEDERLSRIVAVKILHQQYLGQDEFIRRFEQEARLAAGLAHPNIVSIYDVGRDEDTYFIVMEYVEGSSLKEVIAREAPIALDRATEIMRQLGLALDAAHAHGVIHRDIKPENILLTPNDLVKVSDFGIARALTSPGQTATGMVLGSVSYFSPEQAQGKPATAESDLYSSGVVLYEMLTGHLPFVADNPLATAMQHVTQQPAPPRAFVPALPTGVDGVVLKALSKNPEARYHSGLELAEALAAAATRPPIGAVPGAARPPLAGRSISQVNNARTIRMSRSAALPSSRRRAAAVPLLIIVALGGGAIYAATHGFPSGRTAAGTGTAPTATATPPPPATNTPAPQGTQGGGALASPPATATPAPTRPVAGGVSTASATPSATTSATSSATPPATSSATPRPTATKHPSPTPTGTPTATDTPSAAPGGIHAQIVTAVGHATGANGAVVPVDPRNSFPLKAGQAEAIIHIDHLPRGATVVARWTFPGGRVADIALPSFSTLWSSEAFSQPGKYTVSAVVDGKVVGTHHFTVKGNAHSGQSPGSTQGSNTQGTTPSVQAVELAATSHGRHLGQVKHHKGHQT